MSMSRLIVTATDTDAGKTWVCEQLARHWRQQGLKVRALKPFVSGYTPDDAENDVARLLRAQGMTQADDVSYQRFTLPASPDIAAAAEGRCIQPDAALHWCWQQLARVDIGIIEGIGGLMVPLHDDMLLIDWFTGLLPARCLLCVDMRLGCINHTLLSIEAMQRRGMPPDYVLLNNRRNMPDDAFEHCRRSIARFLPVSTRLISCAANDDRWLPALVGTFSATL